MPCHHAKAITAGHTPVLGSEDVEDVWQNTKATKKCKIAKITNRATKLSLEKR